MIEDRQPDWEAFYRDYRKPGYVSGYEISSKLGGGMFGLVYKAQKQSIGKDYAIKFLKVDDGEVRRAVLQELEQVKYFAQVDHPNLVAIEDRGEVDGIPYLVMSYAGQQTLRDLLPCQAEHRGELLNYFLQACRGVSALHERSLVHFDLKPANVFLKGAVARVGDYGLSKLVAHSGGSLSMGRGTPYYMAPEVLQRRGDHRSDIYSLGVMLYEILIGELPFRGDSEWEVLKKHEQQQPEFPPGLLPQHRAVLERCLCKDPAGRYARVEELVSQLTAQSVVPPPLPRPDAAKQAKEFVRRTYQEPPPLRRSTRRSGSVMAMLLMLGAFAFFFATKLQGLRVRAHNGTTFGRATAEPSRMQIQSQSLASGPVAKPTVAARLREFSRTAADAMREAERGRRRTRLQSLQLPVPPDFEFYKDELEPLAEAPQYSEGHATRIERRGLPAVLAAVDMLQDCDYDDACGCRQAFQLQQFLQQACGYRDIAMPQSIEAIDSVARRRLQAAADCWRRLAEEFCSCDDDFQRLLVATGKAVRGG